MVSVIGLPSHTETYLFRDLLHWSHSPLPDRHHHHGDHEHPSFHGLCPHLGFESDRGPFCHSHGHDRGDRLCAVSSLHGHGVVETVCAHHDEGSAHDDRHGHYREGLHARNRSARRRREESEPTKGESVGDFVNDGMKRGKSAPQFSEDRLYRCACCACHGKHHPHHDDSHTPQRRTYLSC